MSVTKYYFHFSSDVVQPVPDSPTYGIFIKVSTISAVTTPAHKEKNQPCSKKVHGTFAVIYKPLFFVLKCRYSSVEMTELLGTDGPGGVGETRPCVLCEYSHAMGNSNGNLHKYWEVWSETSYYILCVAMLIAWVEISTGEHPFVPFFTTRLKGKLRA